MESLKTSTNYAKYQFDKSFQMIVISMWMLAFLAVFNSGNDSVAKEVLNRNFSTTRERTASWKEIARNRSQLVSDLLHGYDKRIRPYTGVLPMDVRVDMLVSNIWAIEEARMDFTIDIYLRQYWEDPRLAFKETDTQKTLTLNRQTIEEIWVPSTYFFNAKKAYFHDVTTDNYLLQIDPSGIVFYSVRLTVTMACNLHLHMFPHDVQTCSVMLESYGYQATEVYYKWNSRNSTGDVVYIAEDLEMPQFMITKVELEERTNLYNIGPHSALVAKFTFHRRLGYYMIQTYVPSMLTVTISWFSFWISPDSPPARVGLGITTVLTMITISNSARAPLPKVSYTKAIDWFLLMCLVYVFGALMEYAIVNFYSFKVRQRRQKGNRKAEQEILQQENDIDDNRIPVNGYQTKLENGGSCRLAVILDNKSTFHSRSQLNKKQPKLRLSRRHKEKDNDEPERSEMPTQNKFHYFWNPYETPFVTSGTAYTIDKYARISFPVTFAVLNSVYWIVYAPERVIF
ncbi:glycine receptor subunit alpha-4-like isoform X2 [Acropora millepora]|uniref:glycine receptor subunit alpha-4-like isoform X2 n=1 Tax=Acropora millepora TaxID=45264 RepID=UPI001CF128BA|nr:glycine receptor subunit alpha-4-like isoform X2 [Acropora millepora]